MGALVGGAELVEDDLGVVPRGVGGDVAEELGDDAELGTALEEMGGEGSAEVVHGEVEIEVVSIELGKHQEAAVAKRAPGTHPEAHAGGATR